MSDAAVALIGVIAGALLTGGLQLLRDHLDRLRARKVAARVLLGDIYVTEHLIKAMLKAGRWPSRALTFERELALWHAHREAFAATASSYDWAMVESTYNALARVPPLIEPGEEITNIDADGLDELAEKLDTAGKVILDHAASKRDRKRLMRAVGATVDDIAERTR